MKKVFCTLYLTAFACSLVMCTVVSTPSAHAQVVENGSQNSLLFPKDSHPFGADMAAWGERVGQWIYQQPFATNPGFDQTGADCANEQHGPVFFIPPIFAVPGSPRPIIQPPGTATRACTIPPHKAIFLDVGEDVKMTSRVRRDSTLIPHPGSRFSIF